MARGTTSTPSRIVTLIMAGVALPLGLASLAEAQTARYSLSGNTRSQIGNGLPLPITVQPAPNGPVVMPPGATVHQTAGPDPKAMTFFLHTATPQFGPGTRTTLIQLYVTKHHQNRTSLIVNGPAGGTAMFSRGGRTGPKTFTWCPGQPLPTASFNPNCSNPITNPGANFAASIRYQATTGSLAEGWGFGGVYQSQRAGGSKGGASVVLRAGTGLKPCQHPMFTGTLPVKAGCVAAFSQIPVPPVGVIGGPIGVAHISTPVPTPNVHPVAVTTAGRVTKAGPSPTYPFTFPKNAVKSYGGPWTTGKVTVRAPFANRGPEYQYLQGADHRVNGLGSISLVAGGVSTRSLSGHNANRGWQNWVVSVFAVPSISSGGLVLLGAILLAASLWMVTRATAMER